MSNGSRPKQTLLFPDRSLLTALLPSELRVYLKTDAHRTRDGFTPAMCEGVLELEGMQASTEHSSAH